VIVENKPGAGGTVGTGLVAKAAPDGQTVVMAAASHLIAPFLYAKLGYDPQKDFVPAAYIGTASYILMIPASVPGRVRRRLHQVRESEPGQAQLRLGGERQRDAPGDGVLHRACRRRHRPHPYKATGEAINEVIADRAQAVIAANIGALQFKEDKRVKLLGDTSKQRSRFVTGPPDARRKRTAELRVHVVVRVARAGRNARRRPPTRSARRSTSS
jgi:tripartite-type tricarboxylate transporter receptor subunit TctC